MNVVLFIGKEMKKEEEVKWEEWQLEEEAEARGARE